MFVNIGSAKEPSDIVDLLLECHERIRSFIALARRLAEARNASEHEIREAAARVVRYFSESLPLHVADEEESILPRLSGREPGLDAALESMHREHDEHAPHLRQLLDICRALQASPERLGETREDLGRVAALLEKDFLVHLQEEERIILPAIRSHLAAAERDAMLLELRARRAL